MRRNARSRSRPGPRRPAPGPGFTLLELLLVMVIIGILLAFILSAALGGVRRAEERATQSLLTKLDVAMADRVDALLTTRSDANTAHYQLAKVWGATAPTPSSPRAQTIARFDQIKAELPDVFVVQSAPSGLTTKNNFYPLNFAASPYNAAGTSTPNGLPASALAGDAALTSMYPYMLPYGVGVRDDPANNSYGNDPPGSAFVPATTGMYGASYTAAAGLYKNLCEKVLRDKPGLVPPSPRNAGSDGVDNDGDGLIDELAENDFNVVAGSISDPMLALLANHTHKTARSEMLYSILVEGQGPFGSAFSRDDFTDSEVRDTDGDGLPEFVDAWGEPLQFYRWPIFYVSDSQKGAAMYATAQTFNGVSNVSFETRQQNTLDPNQTLVDPSWWSSSYNSASPYSSAGFPLSGPASFFQSYFHTLTDPNTDSKSLKTTAGIGQAWDRGSTASPYFSRREYYSRYLILSGGPDKAPGVPVLDDTYVSKISDYLPSGDVATVGGAITTIATIGQNGAGATLNNLTIESQAAQATPVRKSIGVYYSFPEIFDVTITDPINDPISAAIQEAGKDDITNHNLNASGGASQ